MRSVPFLLVKFHVAENDLSLSLLPYGCPEYVRNMKRRSNSAGTKIIAFLAFPGSQILDITGPYQVFVRAAEIYQRTHPKQNSPYDVLLFSTTKSKSILTNCGLNLIASDTLGTIRGPVHTLLVAGGTGVEKASHKKEVLAWLRKMAPRVIRIGSICTGAFLLASAGLLDGKRAATHWKWADELACRYRKTTVDPEPIFIRDGNTYTSAGVLAGMDLALALVGRRSGFANRARSGTRTRHVPPPCRGPIAVQHGACIAGVRPETD